MKAEFPDTITPSEAEIKLARQSSQDLREIVRVAAKVRRAVRTDVRIRVQPDDETEQTVSIPASALQLLTDVLTEMGKGNAVTVVPVHAELTTQQAADLLNVSRPFLIRLITEGRIPCRKVGAHRRILFQDVMAYKRQIDQARLKTLDELAVQAQELDMGY